MPGFKISTVVDIFLDLKERVGIAADCASFLSTLIGRYFCIMKDR